MKEKNTTCVQDIISEKIKEIANNFLSDLVGKYSKVF